MIRYEMVCGLSHRFEAWFPDSAACDEQQAKGLLSCPICGDREVRKAPMAPAVKRNREPASAAAADGSPAPVATASDSERLAAMMSVLRALRRHVEENFEYVGGRFPEEVRRIHYGETEARDVWGQASAHEVRELLDEGIAVLPLPSVPDYDA